MTKNELTNTEEYSIPYFSPIAESIDVYIKAACLFRMHAQNSGEHLPAIPLPDAASTLIAVRQNIVQENSHDPTYTFVTLNPTADGSVIEQDLLTYSPDKGMDPSGRICSPQANALASRLLDQFDLQLDARRKTALK